MTSFRFLLIITCWNKSCFKYSTHLPISHHIYICNESQTLTALGWNWLLKISDIKMWRWFTTLCIYDHQKKRSTMFCHWRQFIKYRIVWKMAESQVITIKQRCIFWPEIIITNKQFIRSQDVYGLFIVCWWIVRKMVESQLQTTWSDPISQQGQ